MQVPDPALLIPVRFHHIAPADSTPDIAAMQRAALAQLGVVDRGLRGTTIGCAGGCVDTRVRLVESCALNASAPCTSISVQVLCHLKAVRRIAGQLTVLHGRSCDLVVS
jgi:hypothetical protein